MSGTEKKSILDLDSDCLEKIFKYLSFTDLVSLRETSTRFREGIMHSLRVAREISLRSFKHFDAERARAFFRDIPIKIQNLDMAYFPESAIAGLKNGFLSTVLNEINLDNVTHLSMDGFDDDSLLREIMTKFRNVRSIVFHRMRIDEINLWLESVEVGRIEEISAFRLEQDAPENYRSRRITDWSGSYKFLMMLRKHGPSLRAFELNAIKYHDHISESTAFEFKQRIIQTLSEFAPNLESLKMHSIFVFAA